MGVDISADGKSTLIIDSKDGTLRVLPVGPGEAHTIRLDGIQARWANWFPDGHHILLYGELSGQTRTFVTDDSGSTRKPVAIEAFMAEDAYVGPDGDSCFDQRDGRWVLVSLRDGITRPVPFIQPDETPIGWAGDTTHAFIEARDNLNTSVTIYKIDLKSGHRELWQVIKPSQTTFSVAAERVAITSDGRWMAYAYRFNAGQLYISTNLR